MKSNVANGSNNNLKIINITAEERPTGEISAGAGIVQMVVHLQSELKKIIARPGKSVSFDIEVDDVIYRFTKLC